MEYIDLYDEERNPLFQSVLRKEMRKQTSFFLIVHVWIRNTKGEYLIQKRAKDSDFKPFMWATTMGVVETNQTTSQTALKEVKEELGLTYQEENLRMIARYKTKSTYANHFTDVFVIEDDVSLNHVVLQESELSEVKYVSKKVLYDMIKEETFWDYQKMLQVGEYFTDLEKSE